MKTTKILLLTAILLAGCSKDENETEYSNFTVSDQTALNQEVYADETTPQKTVSFSTTAAWTSAVEMSDATQTNGGAWVSVSPDHGDVAGTYNVTISFVLNTTGRDRTATIRIRCNSEELTVTVVQKATTEDGKVPVDVYNDEGIIINGIRWATRNVDSPGTFAATPESYGMFYQWNRKKGWPSTSPFAGSDESIPSNWDDSPASGNTWESINDPCPIGWRVPTHEEHMSLFDVESTWTSRNGILGMVFGSGTNTVFLPAAWDRLDNGKLIYTPEYPQNQAGSYWSCSEAGSMWAMFMSFSCEDGGPTCSTIRSCGFSVRCVAK